MNAAFENIEVIEPGLIQMAIDDSDAGKSFEIQPLRRPIPEAEDYPVRALGRVLGAITKDAIDVIKTPISMTAQSFLAGGTIAVQGIANVGLHGGNIPLCEFFLAIGESGERKSGVDKFAKFPHSEWQKDQLEQFKTDSRLFKNDIEGYEKRRKQAVNEGSRFDEVPPPAPRIPLVFCEDPTFEGLYKLLDTGLPSVGLFSDDGGRMLGGHAMNSENRLKTVASLSKLWDGASIDRVRSGDGAGVLYGRRCSVNLLVQHGVADTFLNDNVSEDQGILSRFLITRPESTKGGRFYNDTNLYESKAFLEYKATVKKLINRWNWDRESGELKLRTLHLSPEAKQLWIKFHDLVERQQAPDQPYRQISAFASKSAEHAARLAGIVQLIDYPDSKEISGEYMRHGIELADFYLGEALRMKSVASLPEEIINAEKLLDWLKNNGLKQIYSVKVYHEGPASIRTKAKALPVLKLLEDHGYLTPVDPGQRQVIDGKVRKDVWNVVSYGLDEVLP